MTPGEILDELVPYAFLIPFSITSVGRTRARNQAVGSVHDMSRHIAFKAFDLVPDDWARAQELKTLLTRHHPTWDVVIEEFPQNSGRNHIHVEED